MRTIVIAITIVVNISAMLWGGAVAQDLSLEEVEVDHALTFEFLTPHTDWARPYAGGKMRVLFFCSGHGTEPRECVELMERFDIEAKAIFWAQNVDSPMMGWHGGATGRRRLIDLMQQKWDCFVFFNIAVDNLPSEAQHNLLKSIAEGAGILLVAGNNDARVLKEKASLKELPQLLKPTTGVTAFTMGKGRGVRFVQRPAINYHEGWEVEDDYWHEQLGRAMVWVTNRQPSVHIEAHVTKPEFARNEIGQSLKLRFIGKPVGKQLTLDARIRRPADEPIQWPTTSLTPDAAIEFPIPMLSAGEYHADVRAISSAGVESWTTVPFRVTASRSVSAINLEQDWGEIGDRVRGNVTLNGPAVPGENIRIRLMDRRRREIVRRDIKPTGDKAAFDIPIEPWMPMLITVEAQVREGNAEVCRTWTYFHVTKRNRGRFNFLVWDTPTGTLAPYAEESLARCGTTLQLNWGNPPPYLGAFDVAYVPYTMRIASSAKTAQGIMQPFCWNDEAAVRDYATGLAKNHLPARQHGVFAYSLGDENETRGCCLSPHCIRAYRDYLEQSYGDLQALNASWNTNFTDWQQVGISSPTDNDEATALNAGNYPRWFDRQAFKSYNYVKYCQKYAKAFAAIDPQAKTGFEGAGGFATGDDLDLIARSVTFWSPYPGTADEVIRSIAPRAMPRGNWMGYSKDATSLLAQYWRMVMRGSDAVWWWRWDCIGAFHGWLAPDLRPYPAVKDILVETQVLRNGLGDLLLQSERLDDGIAILYSYPSSFAARVAEGASYGIQDYENAHIRFHTILRELGLQFRYVTDRMVRQGEVDLGKYKVLILPRSEAISVKESQAIHDFVARGGTVIADVRPGLYDEHCKGRPQSVLDDLFGVTRTGKATQKLARLATTEKSHLAMQLDDARVDPTIRVTSPNAVSLATAATVPAMIVNSWGKGKAVLLNFSAASCPDPGLLATREEIAEFFQNLLSQAGVAAAVAVKNSTGKRARGLEIVRWQNGDAQIVGLMHLAPGSQEVNVVFDGGRKVFIYDLRTGQAAGQQDRIALTLRLAHPTWLVLLPQPAPAAAITLDLASAPRGHVVKASLSVPDSHATHVFRIHVQAGDRNLDWLNQNVLVGREPKTFDLPVAHNDPVGRYVVVATDLFTGQPSKATFTVQ